jgi:hypothetical protein
MLKSLNRVSNKLLKIQSMKKKFEMNLLNSKEMHAISGGGCSTKGDTLACAPLIGKVVLCGTYELSCSSGFSYCGNLKNSMTCGSGFSIGPKGNISNFMDFDATVIC